MEWAWQGVMPQIFYIAGASLSHSATHREAGTGATLYIYYKNNGCQEHILKRKGKNEQGVKKAGYSTRKQY